MNPATGPIVVEGAEPGDVLRVHIRAIRPEKTGALMTAPGAGALPDRVKGDTGICPIADGHFTFMGVELPLNPMIGVIGVAPAGESVPCGTPGATCVCRASCRTSPLPSFWGKELNFSHFCDTLLLK